MVDHVVFSAAPEARLEVRAELNARLPLHHVVLETCDRVELYRGDGPWQESTIRHLARVASGLESPLPGEKAVLGQVRSAIAGARAGKTCSPSLDRLFQDAVAIARKVRAATGIDQGAAGHGQALAGLLESLNRPRPGELVLVVGANELTRSIIRWLSGRHACSFILANRRYETACELAAEFRIGAIPLDRLPQFLPEAGIVISATAAPHLIVHADWLPPAAGDAAARSGRERLFCDLAVPFDIDPAIGARPDSRLFTLRDIERATESALEARRGLAGEAGLLVDREVERALALGRARWCA